MYIIHKPFLKPLLQNSKLNSSIKDVEEIAMAEVKTCVGFLDRKLRRVPISAEAAAATMIAGLSKTERNFK